jgi:hypothetical protein
MYRLGKLSNENQILWSPKAALIYIPDSKSELSINLHGGNSFGDLHNFYKGYIISQYRTMQRYDARILETKNLTGGFSYQYKNTLKAHFFNLHYNYSISGRDYIFNTQLDSLGRNTTAIMDKSSSSTSHRINGSTSRFIPEIKMVLKLDALTGWTATDYLLNDIMGKLYNISYNTSLEMINTHFSKLSASYKVTIGHNTNRMNDNKTSKISFNSHFVDLTYMPISNHNFSLKNSYYRNNTVGQENQYFVDMTYRFTIKK